jgi:hypothetical protein
MERAHNFVKIPELVPMVFRHDLPKDPFICIFNKKRQRRECFRRPGHMSKAGRLL